MRLGSIDWLRLELGLRKEEHKDVLIILRLVRLDYVGMLDQTELFNDKKFSLNWARLTQLGQNLCFLLTVDPGQLLQHMYLFKMFGK